MSGETETSFSLYVKAGQHRLLWGVLHAPDPAPDALGTSLEVVPAFRLASAEAENRALREALDRLAQAIGVARSTPEPHGITDDWSNYNRAWEEVENALNESSPLLSIESEQQ